jgi:hypothetical protein
MTNFTNQTFSTEKTGSTARISRLLKTTLKATLGAVILAGALFLAPQTAQARVFVTVGVGIAPPPIPVYAQPVIPGDGYIWTPGYWAYTDDGYQWVDGAWVLAPYPGALWTPGYWAYGPGGYFWNAGYWGPVVGYYGGINYGFGYFGVGFYGGYWNHGAFFYNREYNHFGDRGGFHVAHVYDQRVNGFDGRPGGASFTRATFSGNRNGVPGNRIASGSEMRPAEHFNTPSNNYAGNRGGYHQPLMTRFEAANNGGFRGQPVAQANSFHPSQGSSFRSAPAPQPREQASMHAPAAPSSGGEFRGGGSGFHGGRR